MLELASEEEIHAATIRMQNHGYNLGKMARPFAPPPPYHRKSWIQKLVESSRDKAQEEEVFETFGNETPSAKSMARKLCVMLLTVATLMLSC